ncbi:BZ3500_MvSof-1268-A1-R1_Chr4-1g06804 [Microbotryum saponariae]|uniref:BZ3500_MvSof-1268-A1-R1_Chr4-1g06804 protein n=1 Tax=Microbotryum saponariae TaxID=289078 RepID=A0A2X0LHJ1_9BASI|nr:BZ3500_MvSof-1268-A1-R1_Chr4-1g06804 [Microbotryum saponariae]SDA06461.1 BZ3501_MvSof-1269-A2-R1_Chr4-1g06506 [Microbotryum saponariae]
MADEEQPAASVSSLRARFEQLQSPVSPVSAKASPILAKPVHAATVSATTKTASASLVDEPAPAVPSTSSLDKPSAKPEDFNDASRKVDTIKDKKPAPPPPSRPHYIAPRVARDNPSPSAINHFLSSTNDSTVSSEQDKPSSIASSSSAGSEKPDARLVASENGTHASTLRPAPTPPPSRSRASSTATPPSPAAVSVEPVVETSNTNPTSSAPTLNAKSPPHPIPPLATRPTLSGSLAPDPASTSPARKIPPPVPASRNLRAASPGSISTVGPETAPPSSISRALTPESSSTPPNGDASVSSIAPKFKGPQWLRHRAATESSAAPTIVTSMAPDVEDRPGAKGVHAPEHSCGYSDEDEDTEDACQSGLDDESERIRSESPEDLRGPQYSVRARPVVPPRPSMGANSYQPPISGPLPRSPTSPFSARPLAPPTPTRLPSSSAEVGFVRSASSSTSSGSMDTLPPPPRKIAPPIQKLSDPVRVTPKVPTRPVDPIAAATPSISARPFMLSEPAYIPPPPPSRSLAVSERLAPLRPVIASASEDGGNSSDEGDEDSSIYAKAQELPDATFANRRPPTLRNRRSIHPQGQFYSFAVRGTKLVTGQHHVYIWGTEKNSTASESVTLPGEHKVYALEFTPDQDGRYVWAGTKDGHLFEVDILEKEVTMIKHHAHGAPVIGIYRCGNGMLTIDHNGKVLVWGDVGEPSDGGVRLSERNKGQRVPDKQNFHAVIGTQLWTSSGPATKSGASAFAMRSPQIRVFDTSGSRPWTVLSRPLIVPDVVGQIGAVTASAVVPALEQSVFLGHDNGYVSVWNRVTFVCEKVQRISPFKATAMVGVGKDLWVGYRSGIISVLDVSSSDVWMVKKMWKAHASPVTKLIIDPTSLWTDSTLQVASSGSDMVVHLWDGLLRDDWLDAEMHLRQRDYCTFRSIKALCVSWNVDASRPGDLMGTQANLDFLNDVLKSVDAPDIISFGFQEMINLEDKKLTAKSMLLGKKKGDQKFADGVSSSYRVWHDKLVHAVRLAMPPESPYAVVHVGDMIGLFSCIFVKCSEALALRDVAQITVKTGMGGRYGNKGAILSRFVIDDTSICFINCHLAAGQTHRRQRDRDLVDILEEKSAFSELDARSFGAYALGSGGTTVFDHELVFLSGDLNYRIDARRDVVIQAVREGNYDSLLSYDQLLQGLATNQTFRLRSFKEPPITFAPTYKYDPGTDEYDTSTKKRTPAWCDRILYRADRADKVTPLPDQYRRWEVNVSDHRPISAAFELRIKRIIPDKRALVWNEVEKAWKGVEESRLSEAREYYRRW